MTSYKSLFLSLWAVATICLMMYSRKDSHLSSIQKAIRRAAKDLAYSR